MKNNCSIKEPHMFGLAKRTFFFYIFFAFQASCFELQAGSLRQLTQTSSSSAPAKYVRGGALYPFYRTGASNYQRDNSGVERFAGFRMAVAEINNRTDILPNITIKYSVQDSKRDAGKAFFAALQVAEWGASFVMGPASSGPTMNAQLVLREYKVPQISYSATSALLSNTETYPYFSRTPPSDALQARGQASILQLFNWTIVATISSTDGYGAAGIDAFHARADEVGITVLAQARFQPDQDDFTEELNMLAHSKARVFVMFCAAQDAGPLLMQAFRHGLTGEGYVWIGSDSVTKAETWELMVELTEAERMSVMKGYLGLTPSRGDGTPIYSEFVDRWVAQEPTMDPVTGECSNETDDAGRYIWRRTDVYEDHRAEEEVCAGQVFNKDVNSYAPYSYDGTYLFAKALHQLIVEDGMGDVMEDGEIKVDGLDLLSRIRNISFEGVTGTVELEPSGDRIKGVAYEILNHAGTAEGLVPLGIWYAGEELRFCDPAVLPSSECRAVTWSTADNSVPVDWVEPLVCHPGEGMRLREDGEFECQVCPAGYYAEGEDTVESYTGCLPCPRGSFGPGEGKAQCIKCDVRGAQYFQDLEGEMECKMCPENSERRVPSTGTSLQECVCRNNYYQPDGMPDSGACRECPTGGYCEGFTTVENESIGQKFVNVIPLPVKGFWGEEEFFSEFYECGGGLCDDGYKCEAGRSGRMCSSPAEDYAKIGAFIWKCPAPGYQSTGSWVATVLITLTVVGMFFLVNNILSTYVSIDLYFKNVRVLAVVSKFPLRWHSNLQPVFTFFDLALFDVDLAQPNCLMKWTHRHSFVLQLVLPSLMTACYLIPVVVKGYSFRRAHPALSWRFIFFGSDSKIAEAFNHALSSSISVMSIFYPTVATILLSSFKCWRFADGKEYLYVDPSFQCWSFQHMVMAGVSAALLLVVLIIPLAILILILRGVKQKTLHERFTLERYGTMYRSYCTRYLWWEPLYLIKVLVLVAIQVFGIEHPEVQGFLAMMLCSAALAAQYFAQPFLRKQLNYLESTMIFISVVFTGSGNLFYSEDFGAVNQKILSFIIILVLFIGFAIALRITYGVVENSMAYTASNKILQREMACLVERVGVEDGLKIESFKSHRLKQALRRRAMQIGLFDIEEENRGSSILVAARRAKGLLGLLGSSLARAGSSTDRIPAHMTESDVEILSQVEPMMGSSSGAGAPQEGEGQIRMHQYKRGQDSGSKVYPEETGVQRSNKSTDTDNGALTTSTSSLKSNSKSNKGGGSFFEQSEDGRENSIQASRDSPNAELKMSELTNTLSGVFFNKWVKQVLMQDSRVHMDRALAVDEWISPFVADSSQTSIYSHTSTAVFWRQIDSAFPNLLEMIATAREEEIVIVQRAFNLLCKNRVHEARVKLGAVKYSGLVSEEDQSSVLYWVLNAPPPQRREFVLLLNQMVGATIGEEAAKGKRRRLSTMRNTKSVKMDAERVGRQWVDSRGSREYQSNLARVDSVDENGDVPDQNLNQENGSWAVSIPGNTDIC